MNTTEQILSEVDIGAVQRIVLAGGDREMVDCATAFSDIFGTAIPEFKGRALRTTVPRPGFETGDDIEVVQVKGKNVPAVVAASAVKLGPKGVVGVTGLDTCIEEIPSGSTLLVRAIGNRTCDLGILWRADQDEETRARLYDPEAEPVPTITLYPRFAVQALRRRREEGRPLNARLLPFKPAGKGEVYPKIDELYPDMDKDEPRAVIDMIGGGGTRDDNDLTGEKIATVTSALVYPDATKEPQRLASYNFGIDAALDERMQQLGGDEDSYTLRLLRDPNSATKKAGEEFAEVLREILLGGRASTSEIADLLYGVLVCARANGVRVPLSDVVSELEARNMQSLLGGVRP